MQVSRAIIGGLVLGLGLTSGFSLPAATPVPLTRDALAGADYRSGRMAFQQRCSACHTLAERGSHLVGPNLYGLFERRAGTSEGFAYSEALSESGIRWTADELAAFLSDPEGYLPGIKMLIPEPVPDADQLNMISFLMMETGAADWPRPAVATTLSAEADERPLSERFPSFWNHLMTNTTRYRMVTPDTELVFHAFFNTDGSVSSSEESIRGFWHVDERDLFCYALYGIPVEPKNIVECFPVVAMSIPRFAEELWVSQPAAGVKLHGGIMAGRP